MPPWLATLVCKAIEDSSKGKPDDLLGFGNKKMIAQWRIAFREERNFPILLIPQSEAYHKERNTGVTKAELIRNAEKVHHTSVKNIEKILSPTFKAKK